MTAEKPRELFVTEFKNQFDIWQPLHATNSKEKAYKDAGVSGRVLHLIERSAFDQLAAKNHELATELSRLRREIEQVYD